MDRRPVHAILPLLAILALALPDAARAQQDASRPAADPNELSCGYVEGAEEARTAYFLDLCRAVLVAVHGRDAAPEPHALTAEEAAAALARGDVPLVFALPFELRADADYVLGPAVWIGEAGRWAVAHAEGRQYVGDLGAWLFHALVQAEAWGVRRATVEAGLEGDVGERFLAYEARLTDQLDLPADALRTMISAVGHHGEIVDRWFDADAGPNRPVELGGQLYAPPVTAE